MSRPLAALAALALMGCSAQGLAVRKARSDFPACEIVYVGEWQGEVELRACGVPITYDVTPLGGARRRR